MEGGLQGPEPVSLGVGASASAQKGCFNCGGHGGELTAVRGWSTAIGWWPAAGAPHTQTGMAAQPSLEAPTGFYGPALQGRILCGSSHPRVFCCFPTGELSGAPAHKPAPTSQSRVST